MIVPRMRLILLTAVVMLTAGILAAWQAAWVGHAVAMAAALVVLSTIDATTHRGSLKALMVSIPDVVRMTVDKASQIQLTIGKPAGMAGRLRLGVALPRSMASEQDDLSFLLEKGQEAFGVSWKCRPLKRGRFRIERCHLEVRSALGLWDLRRKVPLESEIRAYPNLVSGQKHLRGLFRRREWGLRTQRRVGKGREFEQLRDYLPGDSFEDIDWKATARRRHPVTRVYQVEQAQEIYVVLDSSRLSTRSAAYVTDRRNLTRSDQAIEATTIFERYIVASLVMAIVADQLSDRFGLLIFGDKPECFIKAGRGRAHYNACRDALYNRMPRSDSPDFDELFAYVGTHLRKRALLVFLTSLDDPVLAESFIKTMKAATRKHILMVNMFRPPGAHPLFSSPDIKMLQGIYQHLVGHMHWASINETHRRLKQHGAALHLLDEEQLCSQLVNQYMDVKQRQII
ncbi:MAG: DUF58 domain-containing protein [Desulfobacteraceae bacterium]